MAPVYHLCCFHADWRSRFSLKSVNMGLGGRIWDFFLTFRQAHPLHTHWTGVRRCESKQVLNSLYSFFTQLFQSVFVCATLWKPSRRDWKCATLSPPDRFIASHLSLCRKAFHLQVWPFKQHFCLQTWRDSTLFELVCVEQCEPKHCEGN